jgi:hypothetical protein
VYRSISVLNSVLHLRAFFLSNPHLYFSSVSSTMLPLSVFSSPSPTHVCILHARIALPMLMPTHLWSNCQLTPAHNKCRACRTNPANPFPNPIRSVLPSWFNTPSAAFTFPGCSIIQYPRLQTHRRGALPMKSPLWCTPPPASALYRFSISSSCSIPRFPRPDTLPLQIRIQIQVLPASCSLRCFNILPCVNCNYSYLPRLTL